MIAGWAGSRYDDRIDTWLCPHNPEHRGFATSDELPCLESLIDTTALGEQPTGACPVHGLFRWVDGRWVPLEAD